MLRKAVDDNAPFTDQQREAQRGKQHYNITQGLICDAGNTTHLSLFNPLDFDLCEVLLGKCGFVSHYLASQLH